MGFESVITTGIALMVLLVVSYALFSGFTASMDGMTSTLKDVMNMKNEQLKTEITADYQYVTLDNNTFTMNVSNTGNTKIVNVYGIEMFITLGNRSDSFTKTYWIPYSNNTNATKASWKVCKIYPDMINPGAWDPGEIMTCEVYLPDRPETGKTGWLMITVANGMTTSGYIPVVNTGKQETQI